MIENQIVSGKEVFKNPNIPTGGASSTPIEKATTLATQLYDVFNDFTHGLGSKGGTTCALAKTNIVNAKANLEQALMWFEKAVGFAS